MCQEKKEREESPELKIVSVHWYENSKKNKEKPNYSDHKQYKDQQNNND